MTPMRIVRLPVTSCVATLQHAVKPARIVRSFSSYGATYSSSRRDMQTATAFRPHALPDNFPVPRNIGVPDTSIAADPPFNKDRDAAQSLNETGQSSPASLREGEAQKSAPTQFSTTDTASAPETQQKSRRSRLRPRKAALTLTPAAVEQMRTLLSQPEPKLIRIGVKNRGCSGLSYHLEYVDKPGKFDEVVEQDGVKVVIDSKALFSIIGSEMDWHEDKLSQRFVFRNPNISK